MAIPLHLPRPAAKPKARRRRAAAAPAVSYPPGFFTELIRQHNWPPGWEPAPLKIDIPKPFQEALQAGKAPGHIGIGFASRDNRLRLPGGEAFLAQLAKLSKRRP